MLSLISPAKSQAFEQKATTTHFTQPMFMVKTARIVNKLKHYSPLELTELLKISPKLAEAAFDKYVQFDPAQYTSENAKQALFAFNGDVYRSLDALSLQKSQITFAKHHLMMLSGLYGLLRPLDLIQPYRLEMGAKFCIDNMSLYDFWQPLITEKLNVLMANHNQKVIINLASHEYSKAIDHKKIDAQWVAVDFKEFHEGKYRTIGLYAKRARGRMVRFMLDNHIDALEDIKSFNDGGYQFNPDFSTPNQLCFTRDKP